MKKQLSIYLLSCVSFGLFAQANQTWYAFNNADTTLVGYKDQKGEIKIEPKFAGIGSAAKFDAIVAAIEEEKGSYKSYYLTKSKKIIGVDSLYFFDNTPDCENDGFIRFRDKKTDKVGLFDRNGKVVIPAEYNDLSIVKNGMLAGLKDAKKKYWDKKNHADCNHFSWIGGTEVLIDTLNTTLIEGFEDNESMDFYSVSRAKQASNMASRKLFKGKDSAYYSFIHFETEFKNWLLKDLLSKITTQNLTDAFYDNVFLEAAEYRISINKNAFIKDNFDALKENLQEIVDPKCDYFISKGNLNQFLYPFPEFENYYNNCTMSRDWKYPVMTLVISHKNKENLIQNRYEFLRTANGYKLISLTANRY